MAASEVTETPQGVCLPDSNRTKNGRNSPDCRLGPVASELESGRRLLDEGAEFVRAHAAHGLAPNISRAADDPHIILRFGQLRARLHSAEYLLTRALRLEAAGPASDIDRATVAFIEAETFAHDIVNEIGNQLASWTGAPSATVQPRVPDHGNHWNYHRVGTHYLSGRTSDLNVPQAGIEDPVMTESTVLGSAVRVITSDAEAIAVALDVAARLSPGASARDRDRGVPVAELDELSASGLLGMSVPRAFGGAGVSSETVVRVFQILSAADPAIGQLPQNHFVFVDAIRQDGTPAQQEFFFRQLLAGARFGNAQAERGGSSALDLRTRLLPAANGGYRLNGTKYYCTGAITAHWIPVAALDDNERQVLAYVPRDARGVELLRDWRGMGQRVTHSGTAHFNDVSVPPEHVIEHWRLFERPNVFHPLGQLLHAAIDIGIAQNALADTAVALRSRKRARLGAPVRNALDDPHAVRRIGELVTMFHAAEGLVLRAAQRIDAANDVFDASTVADVAVAVSEAKAFAEDAVMAITNEMFALLGSSATDDELNLHRHWRNARTHTVHDANQWRYHHAGNFFLNGVAPGMPVRRLAAE